MMRYIYKETLGTKEIMQSGTTLHETIYQSDPPDTREIHMLS